MEGFSKIVEAFKDTFDYEDFLPREECFICGENYGENEKVCVLGCHNDYHYFHGNCATELVLSEPKCPFPNCNAEITSDSIEATKHRVDIRLRRGQ